MDSLLAVEGAEMTPRRLRQAIARLSGPARHVLETQLRFIERVTSEGERFGDHLRDEAPLFVLLESRHVSKDLVLPLQVALMNALSGPVHGDPHRWFILEELNKAAEHPAVASYLMEIAQEVRHRPISLYAAGQRVSDLPPGLWGLATGVFQFHTSSPAEFRKAQEQRALLQGVSYADEVRLLKRGEVLGGAPLSTDRRFAQRVQKIVLRPSCIYTGGETLRVG